jgi:hypothetical protein
VNRAIKNRIECFLVLRSTDDARSIGTDERIIVIQ